MRKIWPLLLLGALLSGCSSTQTPTPRQTPTLEPIPRPNSAATASSPLTEDSLNSTLPSDLIQEIAYFGAGGGGGSGCFGEHPEYPAFVWDYAADDYPVELFSEVDTGICGLTSGESVNMDLSLPDGSVQHDKALSQQVEGHSQAEVNFSYIPDLHGPVGNYA
jgi:hypothetical protein